MSGNNKTIMEEVHTSFYLLIVCDFTNTFVLLVKSVIWFHTQLQDIRLCDSMKLLSYDLPICYLIFNVYKVYSFIKFGISILIPSHVPLPHSFLQVGQWIVTQSMIVSGIVEMSPWLQLSGCSGFTICDRAMRQWCILSRVCKVLSLVALGYYEVNTLDLMGSKSRRLRLQCTWLYTCLLNFNYTTYSVVYNIYI